MTQYQGFFNTSSYEITTGAGTLTSVGTTVTCSEQHFTGIGETIVVASEGYTVVEGVSSTVVKVDRAPSPAWASVSWGHRRQGNCFYNCLDTYNKVLIFSDEEVKIKGGTLEIVGGTTVDVDAGSVSISSDSATGSVDISAENDVDIAGDTVDIVAETSTTITGGTALSLGTTDHTSAATIDSDGYIRKERIEASMFNVTGQTINDQTMTKLPIAGAGAVAYDYCSMLVTGAPSYGLIPKTTGMYKIDYNIVLWPNTLTSGMEVVALVRHGGGIPTYASFDSQYGTKLFYRPLTTSAVIDLRLSWISPLVGGTGYNFWIWHNGGKALTIYSGSATMDCNIRVTKVCG